MISRQKKRICNEEKRRNIYYKYGYWLFIDYADKNLYSLYLRRYIEIFAYLVESIN